MSRCLQRQQRLQRQKLWIALTLLALGASAAGCAGVAPNNDPNAIDDVDSTEQIDQTTNGLVDAPTGPDGAVIRDHAGVILHNESGPGPAPTDKGATRQDPDPCPWSEHKSSNDT